MQMKKDSFGSIMSNGKMINLDNSEISDLEKLNKELKEKESDLKRKINTVFKQ